MSCVGELVTHSQLGRRHNHNLCVAASTSGPLDDGDEGSAAVAAAAAQFQVGDDQGSAAANKSRKSC